MHLYSLSLKYLNNYLKKHKKSFKDATEKDIENHLKKFNPRTQNQRIIIFRDFYRWIFNLDESEPLPKCIRNIKPKFIEIDDVKHAERVITPEEYNLLLEHCNKPMQRALIEALWVSGGRKAGIQSIRVGDVYYKDGYTHIKIRVSKTKSREVIHSGRAEHLLKWVETLCPYRNQKDKPLFVTLRAGKYRQIGSNYAWILLDRLCDRAKIRHIKTHDIRHTVCTNKLKEGVPETHVKTLLGFSKNTNMLRIYDHNQIKDYEDWLNKKKRTVKPTYQFLEQQKHELEMKYEKEIQELKKEFTKIKNVILRRAEFRKEFEKSIQD